MTTKSPPLGGLFYFMDFCIVTAKPFLPFLKIIIFIILKF